MLRRANKGVWCDYCKVRYTANSLRRETPALWTIISESTARSGNQRNYCGECARVVSSWDGGIWELQDQIDYANREERLDV